MTRIAWLAFAVGNLADALTFARVPASVVATAESNPLARALGSGILPGIVCKGGLVLLMLALAWYCARLDGPRWVAPAVLVFFAVGGLFGAFCNITNGW